MPAAVRMPAVVRMPACHSRRFKGERPIGAATGQRSQPPRPCANPPPFVYQALWKKLRVAERLSPWTRDSACPLCRSVETLDHALGGCLFHRVMTAVLKKVWEPSHVKGNQYECRNIPIRYTFGSPQGIAQWAALAAHWTFRNTYRRGGMATLDALLTIWVKLTALLVGWEPLSEYSHAFQLFHDRLVHFRNTGVVSGPSIVYVESCEREDHKVAKRRKTDERKQELAAVALRQIQEALHKGMSVLYTDGSAELVGGVGWVAGYGCHEPGMWEEANHLPVGRKQTINRAELMAVIVAIMRTHTAAHVCSCNRLLVRVRGSPGRSHQMASPALGYQQGTSPQCRPVD